MSWASVRKPEEDAEKVTDVPKVYLSEFEYFGPEVPKKMSDYSPRSIQNIFKSSLPILPLTPVKISTNGRQREVKENKTDENLFSGLVYRENDKPVFTKLVSIQFKILKVSDAEKLLNEEKQQLDDVSNELN